jgi:hypothetical protein
VEIITAIDPDLSAQAVAAAIEQTVIKPAHLQKLGLGLSRGQCCVECLCAGSASMML